MLARELLVCKVAVLVLIDAAWQPYMSNNSNNSYYINSNNSRITIITINRIAIITINIQALAQDAATARWDTQTVAISNNSY